MRNLYRTMALVIATVGFLDAEAPANAADTKPVSISVEIRADRPGARINRNIYGQFSEHIGKGIYEGIWVGEDSSIPNTQGYRTDVLEALQVLEIPVIRWPGGCFADYYDWRDGIGPRGERKSRVNSNWGGIVESNQFGTHEFMNLTELLGASAYIAGNMGSAPARDMAQWLEYMTSDSDSALANERRENGREKPWKVPYFGVGNETWGCGGRMRPEYATDLTRRYSTFVRSQPGAPIMKIASGPHADDYAFTEALMKDGRPGDVFQGLSLHWYTFPGDWADHGQALGFDEETYALTLQRGLYIENLIKNHSEIMDKYDPEKRVALVVDEWGTWYEVASGDDPNLYRHQNTLRDAIVAALSFNIFHRYADRVRMANIAQMINVDQAMVLTDGPDMLRTPTYHIFRMYQPFQDATFIPATAAGPIYHRGDITIPAFDQFPAHQTNITLPAVDASAARATDGDLYLSLVNLDPNRPAKVETTIVGENPGSASGQILTGPEMDTHNTFERTDNLVPSAFRGEQSDGRFVFDLPPKSVVVVQFED